MMIMMMILITMMLTIGPCAWQTAKFELLLMPFHSAQITGLDVCLRKPIFATCSIDKSVRLWNIETW